MTRALRALGSIDFFSLEIHIITSFTCLADEPCSGELCFMFDRRFQAIPAVLWPIFSEFTCQALRTSISVAT